MKQQRQSPGPSQGRAGRTESARRIQSNFLWQWRRFWIYTVLAELVSLSSSFLPVGGGGDALLFGVPGPLGAVRTGTCPSSCAAAYLFTALDWPRWHLCWNIDNCVQMEGRFLRGEMAWRRSPRALHSKPCQCFAARRHYRVESYPQSAECLAIKQ